MESLEGREVPSVTFGSALAIGNDTGHSSAFNIAVDNTGNSYVIGNMTGTVDFDPGQVHEGDSDILTAHGSNDIYVAKYAPDNSLIWAAVWGGADSDNGREIAIDSSGNAYITGSFTGTVQFGAITITSAGGKDAFIAKLNANGAIQWARSFGTSADFENGTAIAVDLAGNVYALTNRVGISQSVMKYGPTGAASNAGGGLEVDSAGNVFMGGGFRGTVDFNPAPNKVNNIFSGNGPAGFVLKLTTNGAFGWVSPFVSLGGQSGVNDLVRDASGNIIVGGSYFGSVDFKPGSGTVKLPTNPTASNAYLAKLNSSGSLVWAKAFTSASTTGIYGLAVDAAGSVYATGQMEGTVDFDPGAGVQQRTTNGGSDSFVVKLSSSGNFSWVNTFGSTEYDYGRDLAVDAAGTVYVTGIFGGTLDFGTNELANPGQYNNGYLVKLQQ